MASISTKHISTIQCKHQKTGNCHYGKKCRYSHYCKNIVCRISNCNYIHKQRYLKKSSLPKKSMEEEMNARRLKDHQIFSCNGLKRNAQIDLGLVLMVVTEEVWYTNQYHESEIKERKKYSLYRFEHLAEKKILTLENHQPEYEFNENTLSQNPLGIYIHANKQPNYYKYTSKYPYISDDNPIINDYFLVILLMGVRGKIIGFSSRAINVEFNLGEYDNKHITNMYVYNPFYNARIRKNFLESLCQVTNILEPLGKLIMNYIVDNTFPINK